MPAPPLISIMLHPHACLWLIHLFQHQVSLSRTRPSSFPPAFAETQAALFFLLKFLCVDSTNTRVSLSISVGCAALHWAPPQSAHPGGRWAVGRPRGRRRRRRQREQTSVATFLPHCPAAR